MLFYFVRHGETDSNASGLLAGSIDSPLNATGHAQARALSARIREVVGHPLHRIFVSDLTRARETAAYLSASLNLNPEVHVELREWDLGEWEGKPYLEFRDAIVGAGEPAEGESRLTFWSRVEAVWRRVHSETEPYVIVSHGVVWLALQDLLQIRRRKIENCQLVRVSRDARGVWRADAL